MNNFKMAGLMKSIVFFMMLLYSATAFSKSDTSYNELKNTALVNNASLSVSGSRYTPGSFAPLSARNYWIDKSYGLVKLSLPAGEQTTSGTATVVLDITYQVEGKSTYENKVQNGVSLTVSIDQYAATDATYYLALDAHAIQVHVVSVSNPSNFSNLTLSASVVTESFNYLTFSDIPQSLTHSTTLTAGGSLPITWAAVANAESYELEWTFISNQDSLIGLVKPFTGIAIPPFYFRNNSSRVAVTGTSYEIPLVYETGYILYRVRSIGKAVVNSTPIWVKSNWTYLDNGSPSYPESQAYLYSGLENNINWQSSLSFAEEGKHKAVVSYHDGSSRNRQAVTRINTDERAVVGETFYDYNGRPIIQTLPVPVKKDSLGFYPNLNVVEGQTSMHKEDITDVNVNPNSCDPAGAKFSTATGSSNYYSPANTFDTNGNTGNNIINKDYIPDAKKYPYSQTVYTPDNTGRIAKQAGMGEANFLGSGKETAYLYGTPLQSELCRLFGTQVGNNAHYKKNSVIDPNGQVSVSYLDLDGKVIATALAGDSPDNVKGLGNANGRSINEDLIGVSPMSNQMSADSLSKIFNKKFIVTSKDINYNFTYTGEFGFYDILCKSSNSYMHIDGVVDVHLTLRDKCGAIIFSKTDSTHKGNTGAKKTVSFSNVPATLSTGEYQITKEVVINEEKLAAYTQEYLASACAKNLGDFQAEEATINTAGCNMTCASCKAEVQRLKDLNFLTEEQINDIDNLCASICDDRIDCRASLNAMKVDMSPNGQYAELNESPIKMPDNLSSNSIPTSTDVFASINEITIDHSNTQVKNELHPELFPLSIFNPNNKLPLGAYLSGISSTLGESREYWRFPIEIKNTNDNTPHAKNYQILKDTLNFVTLGAGTQFNITEYKDVNGDIAYVYVQKLIDYDHNNAESFQPPIQNTPAALAQLQLVDADVNLYKIPVRYLQNLSDFRKLWQSHWAYNMLPYHPEFPYYVACMLQSASNNFDYRLMNMSFDQAKTKGLITPEGVPNIYAKELSGNAQVKMPAGFQLLYKKWMDLQLANYKKQGVPMVLLANRLANCPTGVPEVSACGVVQECDKMTITTDLEWTTYRALYLSVKQTLLKNLDMYKAVNQGYYNGCIGHTDYKTSPDAWYFSMLRQQQITGTVRICPPFNWARGRCHTWNNVNMTVTIPSYFSPNQICFVGNAPYFAKKNQHFYPSGVANTSSSQQAGNCPEVTFDDAADPEHINPIVSLVPCDSDLTALNEAQAMDAERMKYELCGLCPVASDLEAMLTQLKANNKLIASASPVSCSNSGIVLGRALKPLILQGTTNNPVIYWTSSIDANKKKLTGIIQAGSTDKYTIILTIPSNVAYTFDDLASLCCLTVSNTATNEFTLKASFKKNKAYEDFFINGAINTLNLRDCSILPKCTITADATNVSGLLNLLSASGQLESSLPVHLFDGIENTASDDYSSNVSKYYDAVLSILNLSGEPSNYEALKLLDPVWSVTSQSTSGISGKITYTLNGTNTLVIQIDYLNDITPSTPLTMPDGSAHTFLNQPKQFYSLSPVSDPVYCETNNCNQAFDASMISITNNNFVSTRVRIHVPALTPVKCTTIIPATVNRK